MSLKWGRIGRGSDLLLIDSDQAIHLFILESS